jgi:hypothetical protein
MRSFPSEQIFWCGIDRHIIRGDSLKLYFYLKHFPLGKGLNEATTKAVHGLASGLMARQTDVTILCEGSTTSTWQAQTGYDVRCFGKAKADRPFILAPALKE